jgi:Fur family ferric uptake transcriptional regulator
VIFVRGSRWRQNFRDSGYRLTTPREAILRVLSENKKHLSADEIFFLVREKYRGIGLATIYRTLDLLVQMGMVSKFDFGDGRARYELISKDETHHHHLICRKCGRVIDYSDFSKEEIKFIKELEKEVSKQHNFKIDSHKLDFYGFCNKCKEKTSG